jgi:hypothetical protein
MPGQPGDARFGKGDSMALRDNRGGSFFSSPADAKVIGRSPSGGLRAVGGPTFRIPAARSGLFRNPEDPIPRSPTGGMGLLEGRMREASPWAPASFFNGRMTQWRNRRIAGWG